ncbi:cytochrome P450 [Pisolithus croceorrhizus]|nr:cytochrome P450 [Pisolithus croceorrhizus]KAI6117320.1 cytochrome P450 [Pisolithus croceorrhizus]
MTRPFFSKDRISHFDIFENLAENALNQAKARLQEGCPADFQDTVGRFTLDSVTEFLFGKSVRSLSAGLVYPKNWVPGRNEEYTNHPSNVFAYAFLEAQSQAAFRGRFGSFWHLAEFCRDRIRKEMEVCHRFIDPILRDALEMNDKKPTTRCTQEGNPAAIKDEIVNILIAARESSRRPTYDDVQGMKYMRAVINETLRLYPAVPFNPKTSAESAEAAVWSGVDGGPPIYIPPKTRIPYSVFLMHRRKDLWSPDADILIRTASLMQG